MSRLRCCSSKRFLDSYEIHTDQLSIETKSLVLPIWWVLVTSLILRFDLFTFLFAEQHGHPTWERFLSYWYLYSF